MSIKVRVVADVGRAMNRLPLPCRVLGHGWKPSRLWAPNQVSAWQRTSCRRCVDIFLPTPRDEEHPQHKRAIR